MRTPQVIDRRLRVSACLAVLATLCLVFACHLEPASGTRETFTFPTLKDKIGAADTVTILLKDSTGKLVDILFHGPVSATTSFQGLEAPHYDGGKIFIHIEAKQGNQIVYKVERGYFPAQGGDQERIVHLSPSVSVQIQWSSPRVREGESLHLPAILILPQELADKSLTWTSRNPDLLQVSSEFLKGMAPGQVHLVAWLKSDTTRRDSVLVEVLSESVPVNGPDSLRLSPDTLVLAMRGPSGRFEVIAHPTSASKDVIWSVLGTGIVQASPDGRLTPQGPGIARVVATSKVESGIADTAHLRVIGPQKVDSIRFERRLSELFVLGAAESLSVRVYPPLAPPGVTLTVRDSGILRLTGHSIQGLKEGETWIYARSQEDQAKRDSLSVLVFPSEKVDSVRLKEDTLRLYVKGESLPLTPSLYPANLKGRYFWRSENEAVATVDADGRVSPAASGQTQVVVRARADSTKRDQVIVLVKLDPPRIQAGGDTVIARGRTLIHKPVVSQDYGRVTMFKWDLDGDGAFDDSSTTEPTELSFLYAEAKEYPVRFYARDTEGNETLHIRRVKAVNGRVVQITSPKDGAFTNQSSVSVTWQVDGSSRTDAETLRAGANVITRSAQDSAGNSYAHSITVTLDQTAPQRPVVKGPAVPVNTLTPRWSWATGDTTGIGIYRYRVDNPILDAAPATTDTSYIPAGNLTAGGHTLYVQERDEAGNWSASGRFDLTIDTTAPPAPTLQVNPTSPTNNPRPTWTWSGGTGDALRFYRYKLDNDDFRAGTHDTTGTGFQPPVGLSEGVHVLHLKERDSAGNWSATASRSVTLDFTPPATPLFDVAPYSPLNSTRPKWTWRSGGGGAKVFRARVDGVDWGGVTERTDSSFTPEAHLIEGKHTVYVQERDAAGNWSEVAEKTTVLALKRQIGNSSLFIERGPHFWPSFLLQKDGTSLLAYGNASSRAIVSSFNGQSWSTLGDPSTFGGFDYEGSFAQSQSGIAYLAVFDSLNGASVVRFISNQWQQVGSKPYSSGDVGEPALAISKLDVPYIAFRDKSNSNLAAVVRWNGSTWETLGPRGISKGFSIYFNLVFTKLGIPIVAYIDAGYDPSRVVIQRYDETSASWSQVGNFSLHSYSNRRFSLINTESDSLFIALDVLESAGAGEVYNYNGSSWVAVGEQVFPPSGGYEPKLSIDPVGNKYVYYLDNTGRSLIKAFRDGKWITMDSMGGNTEITGFSFGPEGVPWILLNYQDNFSVWKSTFDP